MQTLSVTVPIPETHVLISKDEYIELKEREAVNMTLAEVAKEFPCSKQWFVEKVLDDDFFRRKIQPFAQMPKNGKGKYLFDRKQMRAFMEEYNTTILERAKW